MKFIILWGILIAYCLLTGCGKQTSSPDPREQAETQTAAAPTNLSVPAKPAIYITSVPVMMPILAAWQEGKKSTAVNLFTASDWNARPLFAANMTISMNEDQLKPLSDTDRQRKMRELTLQLDLVKLLVETVAQTGSDAASKGDVAQAKKCFASLKQFGTALANSNGLRVVQRIGQIAATMGETGLGKIGR